MNDDTRVNFRQILSISNPLLFDHSRHSFPTCLADKMVSSIVEQPEVPEKTEKEEIQTDLYPDPYVEYGILNSVSR